MPSTICQCVGCKQMTVVGVCCQCGGIVLDFGMPSAVDTHYMAWPAEVVLPSDERTRQEQAQDRIHNQ